MFSIKRVEYQILADNKKDFCALIANKTTVFRYMKTRFSSVCSCEDLLISSSKLLL